MKKIFAYAITALTLIQISNVHAGKLKTLFKKAPRTDRETPLSNDKITAKKDQRNKTAKRTEEGLMEIGFGLSSFTHKKGDTQLQTEKP